MTAYFKFEQKTSGTPSSYFVIKLVDETAIVEARAIIAQGPHTGKHVCGSIVAQPVDYNPGWSFHLEPSSISFAELSAEVCDANVNYVEAHIAEVGTDFLPRNYWCPWSSRLVSEIDWPQEGTASVHANPSKGQDEEVARQLIEDRDVRFTDEAQLLCELARLEGGENAFPEDLLERGRQIFATVSSHAASGLCRDRELQALLESNGPRTSEALTIVPLLLNLLPEQALKDESVVLVALLILRMGLREFCRRARM